MKNVTWYGQGALRIVTDGKVVYTDPLWIPNPTYDADVILITHAHFDHLSADDIAKVINDGTVIAAPDDCVDEIKQNFDNEIIAVKPGEKYTIKDINIQAVPAYNIIKIECHPKQNNWVGYVIDTQDGKYYYTGDTEKIPEMNSLDVDVIFVPLGQTYTMLNVQQAADTVKAAGAKIAVPVHYGAYEGSENDVLTLKILLEPEDIEVRVIPRTK